MKLYPLDLTRRGKIWSNLDSPYVCTCIQHICLFTCMQHANEKELQVIGVFSGDSVCSQIGKCSIFQLIFVASISRFLYFTDCAICSQGINRNCLFHLIFFSLIFGQMGSSK